MLTSIIAASITLAGPPLYTYEDAWLNFIDKGRTMTASITWDFDTIGQSDGTAVDDSHFATATALEAFFTENGSGTPGGSTWVTRDGEKQIKIPAGDRLLLRTVSSTTINASSRFAVSVGGIETVVAPGQSWPASTESLPAVRIFDTGGTDRMILYLRAVAGGAQVDKVWVFPSLQSGSALSTAFGPPDVRQYVDLGTSVPIGWGTHNVADGFAAVYIDGAVAHSWEGDFTGVAITDMYDIDINLQGTSDRDVYIKGPIKVWHTSNEFLTEPEFMPSYPASDYKAVVREFQSEHYGPYSVSTTGSGAAPASIRFQTSGIVLQKMRSVLTGSSGDTIEFTLKSGFEFSPRSQRGTLPLPFPMYLPNGAEQEIQIPVGGINPLRIWFDGGSGTSTTRQIKIDNQTGSYGSSVLTYDQSKRYTVRVFLRETGQSTIALQDITTADNSTQVWSSADIGATGIPSSAFSIITTFTMGSSGSPEFYGYAQPPQAMSIGLDSWTATNNSGVSGDSPGADMILADDLSNSFGTSLPIYGEAQPYDFLTANTFGKTGRKMSDMPDIMGDYDTLMPRLKGFKFIMGSWIPNGLEAGNDADTIVAAATAFATSAIENGVDLCWFFQPPVDDNPSTDQDVAREANSRMAVVLQDLVNANPNGGSVEIVDLAALYTDAEAAALSTDNVHPDDYSVLGDLVTEANIVTLIASGTSRSRTRDGTRSR